VSRIAVEIVRLAHGQDIDLPAYASAQAAGLDLCAAVGVGEPLTLKPGQRALVPTGFAIALPAGYEAQIRPRSGLALKHGVTVLNSPGTIDADYRGEVKVLLVNLGGEPFRIERGMRIAQMIVAAHTTAELHVALELPNSERGAGGFGSTGLRAD
jgi:dUTP pyrophosphatase